MHGYFLRSGLCRQACAHVARRSLCIVVCREGGCSVFVTSVRACSQMDLSCLMVACEAGHLDVVKHLCEVGGERLLTFTNVVSAAVNLRHPTCCRFV